MKCLFQNDDKYPIKKIVACPGLRHRKQQRPYLAPEAKDKLEPKKNQEASVEPEFNVKPEQNNNIEVLLNRLQEKQILPFDITAPEESLEKIFQDPQNAKTKEDEENEQKDNELQVQTIDPEITEEDKKKLIAAFVFLPRCHLYQKEDAKLKEKVKKALQDKDLYSLEEIYKEKDLKILNEVIEKCIKDLDLKRRVNDEIKNDALEGRAAKEITRNLRTHSYIQKANIKANKKEGIEAVDYLSKEFKLRNISVFLDPIQQQIMSDKKHKQLIFGCPATGKTILVLLKALELLKKDPVLIILPLKGVVDDYNSHFEGSAHKDRLFIRTFREDWKQIIKDHSPHILIDEFAYIQARIF